LLLLLRRNELSHGTTERDKEAPLARARGTFSAREKEEEEEEEEEEGVK